MGGNKEGVLGIQNGVWGVWGGGGGGGGREGSKISFNPLPLYWMEQLLAIIWPKREKYH